MAMNRSNTKLHKFASDAYVEIHLIKSIPSDNKPCGSHLLATSQKKSEGTALIPTRKSATANETTNAFVFVRSRCFLQTIKMTNPFPAIVKIERDQPRIQNQLSIFHSESLLLLNNWYKTPKCYSPLLIHRLCKAIWSQLIIIRFSLTLFAHTEVTFNE